MIVQERLRFIFLRISKTSSDHWPLALVGQSARELQTSWTQGFCRQKVEVARLAQPMIGLRNQDDGVK